MLLRGAFQVIKVWVMNLIRTWLICHMWFLLNINLMSLMVSNYPNSGKTPQHIFSTISAAYHTIEHNCSGVIAMVKRSSAVEIAIIRNKCKEGHKIWYCSSWKEGYPWLVPTEDTAGIVTGLLCELCKCQESSSSSGIWTTVPCTSLRKDCIERHKKSKMHVSAF